eukprot:scaffold2244_cov363-Pavlova_lutheri.AAC.19
MSPVDRRKFAQHSCYFFPTNRSATILLVCSSLVLRWARILNGQLQQCLHPSHYSMLDDTIRTLNSNDSTRCNKGKSKCSLLSIQSKCHKKRVSRTHVGALRQRSPSRSLHENSLEGIQQPRGVTSLSELDFSHKDVIRIRSHCKPKVIVSFDRTIQHELSRVCMTLIHHARFRENFPLARGTIARLGNDKFHHTKLAHFIPFKKGSKFLLTPPYSPSFNVVEGVLSISQRRCDAS